MILQLNLKRKFEPGFMQWCVTGLLLLFSVAQSQSCTLFGQNDRSRLTDCYGSSSALVPAYDAAVSFASSLATMLGQMGFTPATGGSINSPYLTLPAGTIR